MGAPGVEQPRDTIRHACSVAHVVSLTKPTATFHPRPIGGSGFYATASFFHIIPSQVGLSLTRPEKCLHKLMCMDKNNYVTKRYSEGFKLKILSELSSGKYS
ncbi:MAG: hypothetical protein AB1777_04950, partial [Bacteroidota bacterium]